MTQVVTAQSSVVKELQSVDEGVLTTATNFGNGGGANPTMTAVGYDAEWDYRDELTEEEIRRIGSKLRDSHVLLGRMGVLHFNTSVVDSMTSLIDWFLNPTTSKTYIYSQSITGTERFRLMKGCLPSRMRISVSNRGLIRLDCDVFVFQPQQESDSHGLSGTPVWASALTGIPWKHSSGGLNSFTYGGTPYKERGLEIEVSWEYTELDCSDSDTVLWATPSIKIVSGTVNLFKKDIAVSGDAFNVTDRAASRVLKSAVKTLTWTDLNFKDYTHNIKRGSSDATIESLPFTADDIA
jgi:hypothetical protein